jgi:hypothetical protein
MICNTIDLRVSIKKIAFFVSTYVMPEKINISMCISVKNPNNRSIEETLVLSIQ